MRHILYIVICLLSISPLGCASSANPANWFKSPPDEERFSYSEKSSGGKTAPGLETPEEALAGPETPEAALTARPETPEEALTRPPETPEAALTPPETPEGALVTRPEGGAAAAGKATTFTIVYFARGPAGRAEASSGNPRSNPTYKKAKLAHLAHNIEEGVYASYYQHIRNRIKSHWNFLYGDLEGTNYTTRNNQPIIIEAVVERSGLIKDIQIADAAGNPVLAAIVKGAVETSLIDRFPSEIGDRFIKLEIQFYFAE